MLTIVVVIVYVFAGNAIAVLFGSDDISCASSPAVVEASEHQKGGASRTERSVINMDME